MRISDMRNLRVVNVSNGKVLGKIIDLVLDVNKGAVRAIVMPGDSKWPAIWRTEKDVEVPWKQIRKIGKDVILVEQPDTVTRRE
jgi:YlmC/YmxH family sporulation protein